MQQSVRLRLSLDVVADCENGRLTVERPGQGRVDLPLGYVAGLGAIEAVLDFLESRVADREENGVRESPLEYPNPTLPDREEIDAARSLLWLREKGLSSED